MGRDDQVALVQVLPTGGEAVSFEAIVELINQAIAAQPDGLAREFEAVLAKDPSGVMPWIIRIEVKQSYLDKLAQWGCKTIGCPQTPTHQEHGRA
jgi:hypothetical protein